MLNNWCICGSNNTALLWIIQTIQMFSVSWDRNWRSCRTDLVLKVPYYEKFPFSMLPDNNLGLYAVSESIPYFFSTCQNKQSWKSKSSVFPLLLWRIFPLESRPAFYFLSLFSYFGPPPSLVYFHPCLFLFLCQLVVKSRAPLIF